MEEALAAQRRTLGDEHPDTLSSISNLGSLRQDNGDLAGAELLKEEALAAERCTLGGDEHPSTLGSINNLAILCYHKGDYHKSYALMSEAGAGRHRVLGDAHPDTRGSVKGLGVIAGKLRDQASEGVPSAAAAVDPEAVDELASWGSSGERWWRRYRRPAATESSRPTCCLADGVLVIAVQYNELDICVVVSELCAPSTDGQRQSLRWKWSRRLSAPTARK